jgi:hypothetical protein
MVKKIIFALIIMVLSLTIISCENMNISDISDILTNDTSNTANITITTELGFDAWRNSDDALDINGDRKIDEADYELYLLESNYTYWKDSDQALDLNGDRKIDEDDHVIFQLYNNYLYWFNSDQAEDLNNDQVIDETDHEIYVNYDFWLNSNQAIDLNDDNEVDVEDYEIFIEYEEYIGEYQFTNYVYEGSDKYALEEDGYIFFTDLGTYLYQITLEVNNRGQVLVHIPEHVQETLGSIIEIINLATDQMTISRISPLLTVIDTQVTVNEVLVNFTLYLEEIDNGFTTSYVMGFYDDNPTISFDIIKVL